MSLSTPSALLRFCSLSALLMVACNAPQETVPAKAPEPFIPYLSLRPVAVSLSRGATQPFHAELNYAEGVNHLRQPVSWSVLEADGGTISPAGLYVAPAKSGTFHVQVKREDFPTLITTVTVTVK